MQLLPQRPRENYAGIPAYTWVFTPLPRHELFGDGITFGCNYSPTWPGIRGLRREKSPIILRLTFASKFPEWNGDNCLLTRGSAYVDLSFSPLIA